MYTQGKWMIDGNHIVSVENGIENSNETICDFNPEQNIQRFSKEV